jgi:hypothetical protein
MARLGTQFRKIKGSATTLTIHKTTKQSKMADNYQYVTYFSTAKQLTQPINIICLIDLLT